MGKGDPAETPIPVLARRENGSIGLDRNYEAHSIRTPPGVSQTVRIPPSARGSDAEQASASSQLGSRMTIPLCRRADFRRQAERGSFGEFLPQGCFLNLGIDGKHMKSRGHSVQMAAQP